jgi:hypothetical protein
LTFAAVKGAANLLIVHQWMLQIRRFMRDANNLREKKKCSSAPAPFLEISDPKSSQQQASAKALLDCYWINYTEAKGVKRG